MTVHDIHQLDAALTDLGELLRDRHLDMTICVVGGAAILFQEPDTARVTRDVDVAAVVDDANRLQASGIGPVAERLVAQVALVHGLAPGWLSSAFARSFGMVLPEGFVERAAPRTYGGLVLLVASRLDLILLKLEAALQRGSHGERHLDDLRRLAPTDSEVAWAVERAIERAPLGDDETRRERLDRVLTEVRDD
ncbi:MAG: hypothetical protein JWO69_463 [Thermoleophilia bacterium]|jgi:hypothetical protein|nr:hypothetical protein [Thermoleophilia bacterium]